MGEYHMKKNNINAWAASFGMNVIIRYRVLFLILTALIIYGGFAGMEKITMDNSNESQFAKDDEINLRNERFEEIFGNEEFVFVLIEADEVFDHDALAYIRDVSRDLEDNLPFIDELTALTDIEYMEVIDEELNVDDLIGETIPASGAELDAIRQKVLAKKVYVDRIVAADGKSTGIVINFQEIPEYVYLPVKDGFTPWDEADWPADKVIMQGQIFSAEEAKDRDDLVKVVDPRKLIAPALRAILERHQHPDYRVTTTGVPIIDYNYDLTIESETSKFLVITLAIGLVLLIIIFRSVAGVLAPFIVIFASIITTYGATGWLGIPMSTASMVVATLLLVIAVSYSIHVLNHFQYAFRRTGSRRQAVEYAFEQATWPCFVTGATTAMGFLAFLAVEMIPVRNMGLMCAGGVMITYLLVMVLLPIMLSFGKDRPVQPGTGDGRNQPGRQLVPSAPPLMSRWADLVIKYARPTGILACVLFATMLFFTRQITVNSDWMETMGNKVGFVRDADHIAASLGGLYSYEVLIEFPEIEMAKEPEVLQALEQIDQRIRTFESTTLTMSLNDLVKDINMTMHANDREFFMVPESRDLIAQYLLLYEMSGGGELDEWVDYDYQNLRLSVQANQFTTALRDHYDDIEHLGEELFPAGTTVTITGDVPIMLKSMGALVDGQVQSILAAFVGITLMMMIVLRSVRVGLLSMIPNILPVAVVTGIMGLFGLPLNMMTIMVAPMLIGIAVDDTVHYFIHFKQEFSRSRSYCEANRQTFRKIAKAIISTSIILAFGFAVFGLSIIRSMTHVGLLLWIGIMAALLADLWITPALFTFLKPFGKAEPDMSPQPEAQLHDA